MFLQLYLILPLLFLTLTFVFSKDFADALTANGVLVDLILYEGKTHTDLFLQVNAIKYFLI